MFSDILAVIARNKGKILAIAIVVIALRCAWLWQPERQVELHQRHFIQAVQDRAWTKFYGMMAEDFHTPNGHDKKWAMQQSSEVLRQFIALEIKTSGESTAMENGSARVTELLRIDGKGMALAELAKEAVNQSKDPFVFTWQHKSWKPWDWQLTVVDHPLLRGNMEF